MKELFILSTTTQCLLLFVQVFQESCVLVVFISVSECYIHEFSFCSFKKLNSYLFFQEQCPFCPRLPVNSFLWDYSMVGCCSNKTQGCLRISCNIQFWKDKLLLRFFFFFTFIILCQRYLSIYLSIFYILFQSISWFSLF